MFAKKNRKKERKMKISARGNIRQSPQIASFKFQKDVVKVTVGHVIHALPKDNLQSVW